MEVDHSQWNILGYFHYHDHAVVLKSSLEENDYITIKMYRKEAEQPVHHENLGKARDQFTTEVWTIMNYTSSSDVSLYMQQRASPASPAF